MLNQLIVIRKRMTCKKYTWILYMYSEYLHVNVDVLLFSCPLYRSYKRSPPPPLSTLGQNDNIVNNSTNAHSKRYNNDFQHYRKKSRPDHLQVFDPYQV